MLSFSELSLLLLIALVFWHAKLPKSARRLGSALGQFKNELIRAPLKQKGTKVHSHQNDEIEPCSFEMQTPSVEKVKVATDLGFKSLPEASAQSKNQKT
jgi:Sec-independent protein translocase protein TatA